MCIIDISSYTIIDIYGLDTWGNDTPRSEDVHNAFNIGVLPLEVRLGVGGCGVNFKLH